MRAAAGPRAGIAAFARAAAAHLLLAAASACLPVRLGAAPEGGAQTGEPAREIRFTDVAAEVGLRFRHDNAATPERHFPETAEGGGAFLDADGDGRLDVYLVQGAPVAPRDGGGSDGPAAPANAFFRQTESGFFEETGARLGVDDRGVGMGCCAADVDNDGDPDLYVTNYGTNALFENAGGDRFSRVTEAAGVGGRHWSAGCAFGDFDRDGLVDLYVANYVDYDPANPVEEATPYVAVAGEYKGEVSGYPHPAFYPAQPDFLYRNEGGGRFADVTELSGVFQAGGKGLGAAFADYDLDGWPDLYVANDNVRNFLFHNEQGRFAEVGVLAGAAYGQTGRAEAGMGIDWGDYDNDGRPDLAVTNFQREPNSLLRNGNGFFRDESFASGSGEVSLPLLGFGVNFLDVDLDGRLDLFVANGHVLDNAELIDQSTTYRQRDLLLRNAGPGKYGATAFVDVSERAGPALQRARVGRGSAAGDFDGDGDLDLLVVHLGEEAALLRNDSAAGNWLQVRTVGGPSNRDGIGARVEIRTGRRRQVREIRAGSSYLTQSELAAHFGLGAAAAADELVVHWPSGRSDTLRDVAAGRVVTVIEGRGTASSAQPHRLPGAH